MGKHYSRTFDWEARDIQLEAAQQAEYASQMEEYFEQLADTDES